jgi:protein-S-isoprenylcysteine O-methyltransferase Ste14
LVQKNFSTNQLRPFRDRDVVWYTPLLPFVCGGFVYLMVILANGIESIAHLPSSFIPHVMGRKAVGSVVAICGLIFFTLGLGRSLLFLQKKRARKFITTGVFKYTRNPSSFGMIATLFGVSLILNSLALFFITMVMMIFFTITVHFADRLMFENYGEEFVKYKNSTPRFIPHFNRLIRNVFGLD